MDHDEAVTRADIAFHDATAHLYDEALEPIFRAYTGLVVEPLLSALEDEAPGARVLDIGCGTGSFTIRLAAHGFRVQGVDHSPGMLAVAARRLSERGLSERVELATGDVRSLPFEAEQFDVVTCAGVLHHLPELRPCVAEIARVLRPGGVFCAAEPCLGATAALRSWDTATRGVGRARRALPSRRSPAPGTDPGPPATIPEHEEGPIDALELRALLEARAMAPELQYWSFFEGLHRFPLWLQKAVIGLGSLPWRRRSGNMVVVRARKSARAAGL